MLAKYWGTLQTLQKTTKKTRDLIYRSWYILKHIVLLKIICVLFHFLAKCPCYISYMFLPSLCIGKYLDNSSEGSGLMSFLSTTIAQKFVCGVVTTSRRSLTLRKNRPDLISGSMTSPSIHWIWHILPALSNNRNCNYFNCNLSLNFRECVTLVLFENFSLEIRNLYYKPPPEARRAEALPR